MNSKKHSTKFLTFLTFLLLVNQVHGVLIQGVYCLLDVQFIPNTTNFNLTKCYWAGKYSIWSGGWGRCTQNCCDPRKSYEMNQVSIDSCDADRAGYDKFVATIVWSVIIGGLFGIPILFLAIVYIWIGIKKYLEQSERQNNQNNNDHVISSLSINNQLPAGEWKRVRYSIQPQDCPICLSSEANAILPCKHMMHAECWKTWSSKNMTCVICKAQPNSFIQIYCRNCWEFYCDISQQRLVDSDNLQTLVCNNCSKK